MYLFFVHKRFTNIYIFNLPHTNTVLYSPLDTLTRNNFVNYAAHADLWSIDLSVIRNCFLVTLVQDLFELLFLKWNDMGEGKYVRIWKKAWEPRSTTRGQSNFGNTLGGGTPCDNGRVENENRWLKEWIRTHHGGYKQPCYLFIPTLLDYITAKSKEDLSYVLTSCFSYVFHIFCSLLFFLFMLYLFVLLFKLGTIC